MSDPLIYYTPEPRTFVWVGIICTLLAAACVAGVTYAIGWMP